VYGALTFAYVHVGNMEKMREVGEKEIALTPNDVSTLALMGQTLPAELEAERSRCHASAGQGGNSIPNKPSRLRRHSLNQRA